MYSFFPMISRMKYIERWGLMRNTRGENLSEHSLETAVIAHALTLIKNKEENLSLSPDRAAVLAMFHDCTEIITGDLPTPIKYDNEEIKNVYKKIETAAADRLISMLPGYLKDEYKDILSMENDREYKKIVKAADKISALIKCIEEKKSGNKEFLEAEESTYQKLKEMKLKEVDIFLNDIIPLYNLSLDLQNR